MLKTVEVPSLRTVLKADSFLCGLSGIVLSASAESIAHWIAPEVTTLFGHPLSTYLASLGIALMAFAAAVYAVGSQRSINRIAVWTIILVESVWMIDSAVLLIEAGDVLTAGGQLVIIGGVIAVFLFMILEIRGLLNLTDSSAGKNLSLSAME